MAVTCVLLASALAAADESPAMAEIPAPRRSGDEVRGVYRDVMKRAADRSSPDPYVLVPELVDVYGLLDRPAGIPHAEAAGMRRAVEMRLEAFRGRLIRDRNAETQAAKKEAARQASSRLRSEGKREAAATNSGGSAVAARAQQLIDLIQNTIEPDSWDVNGGKGKAMFYAPLNVLVIRNTGEVHEQIGGAMGQLRK